MARISYKSFLLGVGIGLLLSSSTNILFDVFTNKDNEVNYTNSKYTYNEIINNEELSNTENQYSENRDYFIFMVDSNDSIDTIWNKLNKNGYIIEKNKLEKITNNRELKEGIYKIYYESSIEDIMEFITYNSQ